jgi:hypothetical protein
MKTVITKLCILCLIFILAPFATRAVNNPLSVPLDSSILRFNGAYYGMGMRTNGQMLVSDNLFDWTSPVSVIAPELAGPYELLYRNGLFYLYIQGKGYSVSTHPRGPFSKVRRASLSGEDMHLFQDQGGALVSVSRHLGSKKEGEIWMQRYAAPWKTTDRPRQMLDGRRGMWDSLDSADLGDPALLGYRGNYYLLYAANNPSPRTGLREIGVAVNENPVRFENPDKLPDPVLLRNVERLARSYKTLLPSGEYAEWKGRYTLKSPNEGWMHPGFKMAGWRTGKGGFGFPFEDQGAQIHSCRTKWASDDIWIRREFNLPGGTPKTPVLNLRHEGAVQVFLNGKKVFESDQPSLAYSNFDLSESADGVFRPDENVIAVHAVSRSSSEFRFIDFGLFDAGEVPIEPTVYSPTATRFITGPNGFEKWLVYQAYWNGVPGTGLDRVFFYDDELVVDGPTTATTPGYHPPPAPPSFSDTFPDNDALAWAERWTFEGGAWASADGALRQTNTTKVAKAYLRQRPAAHYLFETEMRFPTKGKGAAGVVAYSDGEQELLISVNPSARTWEYSIRPGGLAPKRFKLPKAFQLQESPAGFKAKTGPFHRLRVTKNGGYFEVMLDEFLLTQSKPIITPFGGGGVPGLYCFNTAADFDGVVYTVGWDEHDEFIIGWGAAADGTPVGGDWHHHKDYGLEQKKHSEPGRAFKGDLLDQYEFTVNAETYELEEGKERLYGIFPVFVDRNNYLKAMIDTRNRELVVSGRREGVEIEPLRKTLARRIPHRHLYDKNTAYRDIVAWVYSLRSESVINGLEIRWLEGDYKHLRQEFYLPVDDMLIRYAKLERGRDPILWEDGRFNDADEPKPRTQALGILNPVVIRPEVGNNIGFGFYIPSSIVIDRKTKEYIRPYFPGDNLANDEILGDDTVESDTESRPQETLISVEVESSYFFRTVKLQDKVIIELNGQPMLTVEGAWPASQVGLLTEGQPCFFNGITLMHLPVFPAAE